MKSKISIFDGGRIVRDRDKQSYKILMTSSIFANKPVGGPEGAK